MKRVLLTGNCGFIGSFMAEALVARGVEVAGVDDLRSAIVEPGADTRVQTVLDYLADPEDVDAVVHCASPVGSAGVLPQRGLIVPEVVETTAELVDYCIQIEAPLVNISTSEVYGFSGSYYESDACRVPVRPSARLEYAVAKLAGEFVVMNSIHRGLRAVTVRPFNVAGPGQRSDKGFVLPTFVEQALADEPLTIYGDGSQKRAFTAVTDLCRFVCDYLRPLSRPGSLDGQVFNVGNPGNVTTILGLANRVRDRVGGKGGLQFTDGKIVHGPDYEEAEGHVKTPTISNARSLGWHPAVSLDDLIEQTAAHYRHPAPV